MFSQRVKHHKNIPEIYQTAKFLLSFYNNTRCMAFISIHKSVSRGIQIPECLMILDHLIREAEL